MGVRKDRVGSKDWRGALLGRVAASVIAGLTLTTMAVLVPTSVNAASTKLTTLNIITVGQSFLAPTIIGENEGIFRHYGLNINLSFVSGNSIVLADLLNGTSQFGTPSMGPLLLADAAGEGIKCISNVEEDPLRPLPFPANADSLMVAAGSSITNPAQLVGKTVGVVVVGGSGAMLLDIAVSNAGGDFTKVNLVSMPFANMAAEIANGTLSAAVEIPPFETVAGQQQLVNLDTLMPGTPSICYTASASYIASHGALVNAFVKAQQQSILYTAAHFSKITPTVLAEASGLPASEASKLTVPTKINFSTNLNPPGILSYETLMKKYGYLTQPIMPLSAVNYTAPGTPMTKLLFNAAGKFIVKKTITCVKGKLTKKVTGVNPKCPSGYHLKK